MRSVGLILAALLLSSEASAATISKCVDEAGKVTFTKNQNCPRSSSLDSKVQASNPRISSDGQTVKLGEPKAYKPKVSSPQVVVREVPVVYEQEPEEVDTYRGPKRTDRKLRKVSPPPPRVEMREVNINSTRRTKDGRTVGTSERVKIPVYR